MRVDDWKDHTQHQYAMKSAQRCEQGITLVYEMFLPFDLQTG